MAGAGRGQHGKADPWRGVAGAGRHARGKQLERRHGSFGSLLLR